MSRNYIFAPGEYYHLYNRGTEKKDIFYDRADYLRFVTLLYICNGTKPVHLSNLTHQGRTLMRLSDIDRGKNLVSIGAYCLMSNHFHILVKETDAGVSKFMQKLCTAYTMYFNKRYERSGALFQGTFKATHASTDNYLKYLFAYIHLNPVKLIDANWRESGVGDTKKILDYLGKYQYSSFLDYSQTTRNEGLILDKNAFPEYFITKNSFVKNLDEWLTYEN